ncbi:MAG TPA: acyl-CoA dehydrogenase C-terminal domain-containing protein [Stellaceae bacterium]|nr:acyl-CoA dehydrogenase C-terminal domain-containing protein [Stellaceae bacterium]
MPVYRAPLDDYRFLLHELFEAEKQTDLPQCADLTADTIDDILANAGKFCEEVLHPLNQSGDEEGCHFENGVVRTPKGFKEAYDVFRQGGWTALACDPEYGGQGLPHTLQFFVEEMVSSANMSFGMYPGLSNGAYSAIYRHGTAAQKSTFLPHLVDGSWSGTMCLTEPQCGTDLGQIRTRAEPAGTNGVYKITGTKIFISAGEHDLTDNIIHLVLARIAGGPPGIRGISLFIVPKFLVKADGSVGARNGVRCGSIEHKMGIKASATCVINFEEAEGYLVGEAHKGMRAMFTMMNAARLGVGLQGLALGETAYQTARQYAQDRLQGRALKGEQFPDKPGDPIIVHPDVRRMLLTMKAYTEGARALAGWVSLALDKADRHPDPDAREEAEDFIGLMTPIVKAMLTDNAFAVANLGVQVFGGHGYIREWGMEQLVRDARITMLYEGANGIQALDLVGRKMPMHNGRLLRRFFHPVDAWLKEKTSRPELQEFVAPVIKAFGRLQQVTALVAQKGLADPDEAGAAASEYLRAFGLVAMGYLWARIAEVALTKLAGEEALFYKAKLATARFYIARLLPETNALFANIAAGAKPLMELEAEAF